MICIRRRNISASRIHTVVLAGALFLGSMPALAQAPPERLSDAGVKTLIEQVDEGRDKFEGNLDNQLKNSTLRGPNGETKVSGALQDYQDNTKKLKDRFKPEYSASTEAATVLEQSTAINTFMQTAPSTMNGRSEWDRQTANLKRLAESYGTTFPLPDGAAVRRANDKEAADTAAAIATAADRFKKDIDKDKTLPKPDKDGAKKDVEMLIAAIIGCRRSRNCIGPVSRAAMLSTTRVQKSSISPFRQQSCALTLKRCDAAGSHGDHRR